GGRGHAGGARPVPGAGAPAAGRQRRRPAGDGGGGDPRALSGRGPPDQPEPAGPGPGGGRLLRAAAGSGVLIRHVRVTPTAPPTGTDLGIVYRRSGGHAVQAGRRPTVLRRPGRPVLRRGGRRSGAAVFL